MKQAIVTQQENTRLTLLEDCERKISTCLRRGIDATIGIGQQLSKINEMELYRERGFETLNSYCWAQHNLDARNVTRFMGIADSAKVLKDHGLELPLYESHVAELASLEPADQALVWDRVIRSAQEREEPVTTQSVRTAVEYRQDELKAAAATKPVRGATTSLEEPDLDLGSNLSDAESRRSSGQPEAPSRITLSEDGEMALERIRRLCGQTVADAIEYLRIPMSERELIMWAKEEDPASLTYYIEDERWSVAKAIGFVHQAVTERTTVARLMTLARANGGHFEVEMEGHRITVDLPK